MVAMGDNGVGAVAAASCGVKELARTGWLMGDFFSPIHLV